MWFTCTVVRIVQASVRRRRAIRRCWATCCWWRSALLRNASSTRPAKATAWSSTTVPYIYTTDCSLHLYLLYTERSSQSLLQPEGLALLWQREWYNNSIPLFRCRSAERPVCVPHPRARSRRSAARVAARLTLASTRNRTWLDLCAAPSRAGLRIRNLFSCCADALIV